MTVRFDLVTIDSPQPDRLAVFWSEVLHLHESEREDGDRWIVLSSADDMRRVGIQRGDHRPGGMHLDIACEPAEFDGEVARLLRAGAVELSKPRHESYGSIVNLADPDGNAFDLCAYL